MTALSVGLRSNRCAILNAFPSPYIQQHVDLSGSLLLSMDNSALIEDLALVHGMCRPKENVSLLPLCSVTNACANWSFDSGRYLIVPCFAYFLTVY
ncbi:hypothetical protein CW304_11895 [Bacillus sp. UFRGS-B20]|nr:hypothetical protein CW304_11895 [Bacillus sp. UFRGS-B20]